MKGTTIVEGLSLGDKMHYSDNGHFGVSHFVFCREVLMLWERGPKGRPLLRDCPFLNSSEVSLFFFWRFVLFYPCFIK